MHSAWLRFVRPGIFATTLVVALTSVAAGQSAGEFVYVLRSVNQGTNQLYGFSVNASTGVLALLPGFPQALGLGAQFTPAEQLFYDQVNARLYALNDGDDTLAAFSVNRVTGAVTPLPFSPIALGAGAWSCVTSNPSGSVVVATETATSKVASYAVTSSSATPASGSPYSSSAAAPGYACEFSTDGRYVYVGGEGGSSIAGFSVNATSGVLSPLTGSPFNTGSLLPVGYATDATGRLFSANFGTTNLRVFTSSGGVLSPATGNPFASGLNSVAYGLRHPSGFYMVANRDTSQVGVFTIGGTGAATTLAPAAGSPFASDGGFTNILALNAAGTLLAASNGSTRNVSVFRVTPSANPVLTLLASQPGDAAGSTGIITGLVFASSQVRLDVTVTGGGTVTSNLGGIACGATCSAVFDDATTVILTATPAPGYQFVGWTGGSCSGTGPCTTTIATSTTVTATFSTNPIASLSPSDLNFGAVNSGGTLTIQTPPQNLTLTLSGSGAVTWTAAANQPWITVSPTSGTGAGTITVSVSNPGGILPASGLLSGAVTLTTTGAANNPVLPINLTVIVPGGNAAPGGAFDTPTDGQSGVTGSIAVTGWAIDDIGVSAVRICREPLAGESVPNQALCGNQRNVFVGTAVLVLGARPDIAGLFPTRPYEQQAGWGYLLLTNYLPNEGNGTFRLTAYAEDYDGFATFIGAKTITCTNATATVPFGAIDTPEQGGTASGASYVNFGWVLAAQRNGTHSVIPPNGSTITVFVDSLPIGTLDVYDQQRTDIQTLFPGYFNSTPPRGAVGAKFLNTTTLANGVHTIAWLAQDTDGAAAGIGSRYFTVSNSGGAALRTTSSSQAAADRGASSIVDARPAIAGAAASLATVEPSVLGIGVRHGFDEGAVRDMVAPDGAGVRHVRVAQLDRVVIELDPAHEGGATYRGYSLDGGTLRELPIGSHLDVHTGEFAWAPGLAFGGTHPLVFVREANGRADQTRVDVSVDAQSTSASDPRLVIDTPRMGQSVGQPFTVAGWAIDPNGPVDGTGIDTLHVWAYPVNGGPPIWAGAATHGGQRPDVAGIFGGRFLGSGFSAGIAGLPAGAYDIVVYAHSVAANRFTAAQSVRVTVK